MDELERPGDEPGLLRVVVLGAYGLIGSAVMRHLMRAGHRVTGVGRSGIAARKADASADWQIFDIAEMTVDGWQAILQDVDVVVNASGALQSGGRDDLTAIHETALSRLADALSGTETLLIQISAAGVAEDASTEFFRSKARGEAALRASDARHVILRPTLVLAPGAYGGTALLRAAASLPFVLPDILPKSRIQTVHIDDLSVAVLVAAEGRVPPGTIVDVTAPDDHNLLTILKKIRAWQGIDKAWITLPAPYWLLRPLSAMADLAGRLGWRSPIRTTAVRALSDGVRGDLSTLTDAGGPTCRPLDEALRDLPATLQERWFARAYLLFPLAILTLSFFWILTGVIGLASFAQAQSVLSDRGWSSQSAGLAVVAGSAIDIALGLLILWRSKLRRATLGMIAVSLAYLAGATLFVPDLWSDPLGPLVKIIPTIMLCLFVLAFADDR